MIKGMSKSALAAQVKQFIAGANKHFPNGSQVLQVGGVTSTVSGLTGVMQAFVDNRDAVEVSKAATKAKIETERTQAPSQLAVFRAFETVIRATFGNSADVLADFGLAPHRARTPMTAEEKAVAAAKRKATRAARHTMGKNQKKTVQGSITAKLVVTPLTPPSGSTPVAPPEPVGNAPTGVTPVTPHAP
jgi:hypothetical protein